jgi:hypothetical protein
VVRAPEFARPPARAAGIRPQWTDVALARLVTGDDNMTANPWVLATGVLLLIGVLVSKPSSRSGVPGQRCPGTDDEILVVARTARAGLLELFATTLQPAPVDELFG